MSTKAKRILALLNNPKHRTRLMSDVNRADQDEPAQVGGNQEMTILKDMASFDQEHDQHMQDLKGGSHAG